MGRPGLVGAVRALKSKDQQVSEGISALQAGGQARRGDGEQRLLAVSPCPLSVLG